MAEIIIGGLSEKQITGVQRSCPVFQRWGGNRDFCNAQCAWTDVPSGTTATCPQVSNSPGSVIPKSPIFVSAEVIARDLRGETGFDGSGAQVVGNGKAEIVNYSRETAPTVRRPDRGILYRARRALLG